MTKFLSRLSQFIPCIKKTVVQLGDDAPHWITVVLVCLPSLVALALPGLLHQESIFDFLPNSSDEIIYWREISSFVNHGFGSGQYSTNEYPAAFAKSPFGSHGPAFIVLYGLIGKLFGWQGNSAVWIHLILAPLSIWQAIRIARPDTRQQLMLLALLLTWWPLQLYIPTNMQEVFHMCMAVVLAAMFHRYIKLRRSSDGVWIAIMLLLLIPLRLTWAFLFFPLVFLAFEARPLKALGLGLVITAILSLVGVLFIRHFYSPYPWFSSRILELLLSNWQAGLRELIQHFLLNIGLYFRSNGLVLTVLLRYQLFVALLAAAASLGITLRSRQPIGSSLFHVANLGAVVLFVLLFYDILDTRDYRMFLPPLLLSAVLFIFQNRLCLAGVLIVSNLVFAGAFFEYYQPDFTYDTRLLRQVEQRINPELVFDPEANRWCNTIAVAKYGSDPLIGYGLTVVPAGFGITTILDWAEFIDRPLQSKYVWLDSDYEQPNYGNPVRRLDLQLLAESEHGDLYENPHSPCD